MTQYYALFDDPNQRNSLVNMYNVSIGLCKAWRVQHAKDLEISKVLVLLNSCWISHDLVKTRS